MCFKNVLKDLSIKNLICIYDNAISIGYVNKKNQRIIWDTQKNIGAEEKWAQKKEEQEKKTRKNNPINGKYN